MLDWYLDSPTTDEMDQTTEDERNLLVAYCEHCEAWWHFDKREGELCPTCDGKRSQRHGYQLTSQRTFNEKLKRKKIKR